MDAAHVMIDGEPRLSCLCLAGQVSGSDIITVEGLAMVLILHQYKPVCQIWWLTVWFLYARFLNCLTGSTRANPSPTDDEVAEAIEGNLCRCTGYQQIIESIQEAAKIHRGESAAPQPASAPHPDPHPDGPGEPSMPPGHAK